MEIEESVTVHDGDECQLVDSAVAECCQNVLNAAKCSEKTSTACILCSSSSSQGVHTLCDLFDIYGKLLFCVTFHVSSISYIPFLDLFILDSSVLGLITENKEQTVENVLSDRKVVGMKRMLANQLVARALAFFAEENIKIYCEQELESLFYKFYKKGEGIFSSAKDYNMLLWILFKRGESNRFFRVYEKMEKKNIFTYKLALLTTLEKDCLMEPSQLLNEIERRLSPEDLDGSGIHCCCEFDSPLQALSKNSSLAPACAPEAVGTVQCTASLGRCRAYHEICSEISSLMSGVVSDFVQLRQWHEEKKEQMSWHVCVEMWSKNREDGTGLVDEAMISICTEHRKFEQGWLIYTSSIKQEGCVAKIAFLCLKALKHTGDPKWIERVSDVVRLAGCNKMKSACCEITNSAVQIISNVSEEKRKVILKSIIDGLKTMSNDEEVVCCLLHAFLTLCTNCKSAGTCEMCVEYANKFYEEWKVQKKKTRSFFFGGSRGTWDKKIYCNMLGVCTETENCKGFYSVCCDIVRNDMDVDVETLGRLERYHREKHKNCKCTETRLDTKQQGMFLLKHFLHDMK
eukprot:jgi/Antlo1/281/2486